MKFYIWIIIFFILFLSCNDGISADNKPDYSILSGKKICIDPGHQQIHNSDLEPIAPNSSIKKEKCSIGAKGIKTGIPEDVLNLEIALKLKKKLESYGVIVSMTRETNNVNISNKERAEIGNKSEIMIRLHADDAANAKMTGISILVPGPKFINDKLLISESKKFASIIIKSMVNLTGAKNNGLTERNDLTGFNWSKVPVILIEMGFLTNEREDILLNTSDYQDKIVNGIIDGLVIYYNP
jgi:N-acetylmuramoyl-L-alanine amidase